MNKKKRKKEILRSMNAEERKQELERVTKEMEELDVYLTSKFGDWRNKLFFDEKPEIVKYQILKMRQQIFKELVDRYDENSSDTQ